MTTIKKNREPRKSSESGNYNVACFKITIKTIRLIICKS